MRRSLAAKSAAEIGGPDVEQAEHRVVRTRLSLLRPVPVLSPDLLGYGGEAGADPDGITIDTQVEHLRDAIDRAAPDARVHLVGHSVGGVIASAFAHHFPDRVASLVNVEGNFTLADAFGQGGW